jgi:N-acetylglucosaminyldiphosphoundecaprenol N-acetyl-beta-D-mannosaminyltransferase
MREYGLEWLYRFTQDPKRLWKRYLVDFAKFGLLVWPSVVLHQYAKKMILGSEAGHCRESGSCSAVIGGNGKFSTLALPAIVDVEAVSGMAEILPERPSSDLILDAGKTVFVDSAGLALLAGIIVLWERHGCQVLVVGMSGTIRRSLFCNRLGDLFTSRHCRSLHEARVRLEAGTVKREFQVEHRDAGNTGSIRVVGDLRNVRSSSADAASLVSRVYQESCTIDLSRCTSVDTSGIIFLLKVRSALVRRGKRFTFTGITGDVKQMVKVAQVESLLMSP